MGAIWATDGAMKLDAVSSRRSSKLLVLAVFGLVSSVFSSDSVGDVEVVKVFGFQEDTWAPPQDTVVIQYNLSQKFLPGESTDAPEVTVCYRVQPTSLATYEAYISLALNNYTHDVLFLYRQGDHTSFYYNGVRQQGFANFTTDIRLRQWTHYCHVFSWGEYRGYVQGEERARGLISTSNVSLSLNSMLTLGQEQDQVSGGYDVEQIFRGLMTQVNIWDRVLSPEEVAEQASCAASSFGNIFSTDRDEVEVFGVRETFARLEVLCEEETEFVIFPERGYLRDSILRCSRVGYTVYSPSTRDENERLHNESLMFTNSCVTNYHLWVGVTDEEEEGVWRSFTDNSVVQDPPFDLSEPNGRTQENCILMFQKNGLWADTWCGIRWLACVPCQVGRSLPLRLRGLCFNQETETFFEILGYKNNKPYFHGYYGLMIYMTEEGGKWEMFDTRESDTIASLSLASESMYPIGRHNWTISKSMCGTDRASVKQISLSVCENSEFTCTNGECVPKEKRCDARNDCTDFSDEDQCEMLLLSRGYRRERPSGSTSETVLLNVQVQILQFTDISDIRRVIRMELTIETSWRDPRPKYLNLQNTLELNRLSSEGASRLWRPEYKFPNVQNGNIKTLRDDIWLRKVAEPQSNDFNDVRMDTVYTGDAAIIVRKQHMSGSFVCSFDVFYYPFDTQLCSVLVQVASLSEDLVAFSPSTALVLCLDEPILPTYVIDNCLAKVTSWTNSNARFSLLKVTFELRRKRVMQLLNIYLPTSMLLVIGYSTLFVKVAYLQVRLTVSLTTLLVLYTLFSNTSDALPISANVKMIDVWFFYCIFLLFFIILSHVVVEHLDEGGSRVEVRPQGAASVKGTPSKQEKFMKALRVVLVPSVVVVFNVVYWSMMFSPSEMQ